MMSDDQFKQLETRINAKPRQFVSKRLIVEVQDADVSFLLREVQRLRELEVGRSKPIRNAGDLLSQVYRSAYDALRNAPPPTKDFLPEDRVSPEHVRKMVESAISDAVSDALDVWRFRNQAERKE
jgi:hypothetical protein